MTDTEAKAPTDALITRLESADGPDRELDAMIRHRITSGVGCGAAQDAPHYTASIDAALTLVPEGWSVHLHTSEDRPDCEIHITVRLGRSYPTNKTVYGERSGVGSFGMVALALAAAALKARGV